MKVSAEGAWRVDRRTARDGRDGRARARLCGQHPARTVLDRATWRPGRCRLRRRSGCRVPKAGFWDVDAAQARVGSSAARSLQGPQRRGDAPGPVLCRPPWASAPWPAAGGSALGRSGLLS